MTKFKFPVLYIIFTLLPFLLACPPAMGQAADEAALRQIIGRAEAGDVQAQIDLAVRYYKGDGLEKDDKLAFHWMAKAAEQGNMQAQATLGDMYYRGIGVNRNKAQAFAWYMKAAEQGSTDAQECVGEMLYLGQGVQSNDEQAFYWFSKSALQGNVHAQYRLGGMYDEGLGVAEDQAQALHWLLKAAEQGHADAQYSAGEMYYFGDGVARDYQKALYWLSLAAEQGQADAQYRLGEMYEMGRGVEHNPQMAVKFLRLAAGQNDVQAQYKLYTLLENNPTLAESPDESLKWLRAAAQSGHVQAQAYLASTLLFSQRLPKDDALAVDMLQKAAQGGDQWAIKTLADALLHGKYGLRADQQQAIYWLGKTDDYASLLLQASLPGSADYEARKQMLQQAIAISRDNNNREQWLVALHALAMLMNAQGQYQQTLELLMPLVPELRADDPPLQLALFYNSLGNTLEQSGQIGQAGPWFEKSLSLVDYRTSLKNGLAFNYALYLENAGQLPEAQKAWQDMLDMLAWAPASQFVDFYKALVKVQLGRVLYKQGQWEKARTILHEGLGGFSSFNRPHEIRALGDYALALAHLGEYDQARQNMDKALEHAQTSGLMNHPLALDYAVRIGRLMFAAGRSDYARHLLELAVVSYGQRWKELGNTMLQAEQQSLRPTWQMYFSLLAESGGQQTQNVEQAFTAMQMAASLQAGQSLEMLSARFAATRPQLAELAQKRQLMVARLQQIDQALINSAMAQNDNLGTLADERLEIHNQLAELDEMLKRDYARYFDLTQPAQLSLEQARKLLRADEAIVVYYLGQDKSFVCWLSRDKQGLMELKTGGQSLSRQVARFRASLEPGQALSAAQLPRPDLAAAYGLYRNLLAPVVAHMPDIKQLLIVPDGPLVSLPFAALLTQPAGGTEAGFWQRPQWSSKDYSSLPWLVKTYATSILPSVPSLRTLRDETAARLAPLPFVGIGDPLLSGGGEAQQAMVTRGGVVDPLMVRALPPLPETAWELEMIGHSLGSTQHLYLRERANKSAIVKLDLSRFQVVAFATHALVSGELRGLKEPALVLTPVDESPDGADNGILSAGEIAALKLNAQWVVLSACNTMAADGSPDAQGLSGLSKAFFLAGGRSLLVSNWPVISAAAVELTGNIFSNMKQQPALQRGPALRQAMLRLLNDQQLPLYMTHPAAWAPFTLVGD